MRNVDKGRTGTGDRKHYLPSLIQYCTVRQGIDDSETMRVARDQRFKKTRICKASGFQDQFTPRLRAVQVQYSTGGTGRRKSASEHEEQCCTIAVLTVRARSHSFARL
jgi:hypothetical protein